MNTLLRFRVVTGYHFTAFCLLVAYMLLAGCASWFHAPAAGTPSGGAAPRGETFHDLAIYLRWAGAAFTTVGIAACVAGFAVPYLFALPVVRRLGGAILGAGIACFFAIGLIDYFGHWLMWGLCAVAGIVAAPALVGSFVWLERRFKVDLWPGPGIGPGGESLADPAADPAGPVGGVA